MKQSEVIKIECFHCSSPFRAQKPTFGSMAIFECPKCHELGLLLGVYYLPVDKNILLEENEQAKKDHLVEVIMNFAGELLSVLLNEDLTLSKGKVCQKELSKESKCKIKPSVRFPEKPPITREEARDFAAIDLNLLDKKGYFNSLFGGRKQKK